MRTQLFVISDLHLGGEPGEDGRPGFQMCPPRNQNRLAGFVGGLPEAEEGEQIHLVLAGDVVDFLAEKEFQAFTGDQEKAAAKLQSILRRSEPFWKALAGFVKAGGHLTVMLGNHDIELCLPALRRLMFAKIGGGRLDFIYDNQALALGPVLIEHGNRYDSWNAVPHASLRRVRSQISRRLGGAEFPGMPGSRLVVEVMNELKENYSWVDLLKPETSAVLPILAALGAGNLKRIWKGFRNYQRTLAVDHGPGGEPLDDEYIAAGGAGSGAVAEEDQEMWDLAQNILAGGSAEEIGWARDAAEAVVDAAKGAMRAVNRAALRTALRAMAKKHLISFDTTRERKTYFDPAKAAANRGFEVVIYGHSHLAKNVKIQTGNGGTARYLNTGTWADLIRMPDAIFEDDRRASKDALDELVADLAKDEVGRWRRFVPTFAQIVLENDKLVSTSLRFADEEGSEEVTTDGLISRLSEEQAHD